MKKIIAIGLAVVLGVTGAMPVRAEEKTETSEARIVNIEKNCEDIRGKLENVRRADSQARAYLGRYYEVMLSSFITPLNVWLVGRSLSNAGLVENQNEFKRVRGDFVNDYIQYQKGLEELMWVNCKTEPKKFDEKLTSVRKLRAVVAGDGAKLRKLMDEQVKLVTKLKESL